MNKIITIATIIGLLIGTNASAKSTDTKTTETAIKKAAKEGEWKEYAAKCDCKDGLYFKKTVKKRDYHSYRYQNRNRHKTMTVYAKVDYDKNGYSVEFANKTAMNPGMLGIDSKIDNVITEFKNSIDKQLASL